MSAPTVLPAPAPQGEVRAKDTAIRPNAGLAVTIPALPSRIDLDEEIREAFLADATDLFERIEPLVLGLGETDDPRASLLELGRCFHTLKGAAGSVGLADLARLVHTLEEHLTEVDGPALVHLIDVLLETLAYLEGLLRMLRAGPASREPAQQTTDGSDGAGGNDEGAARRRPQLLRRGASANLLGTARRADGPGFRADREAQALDRAGGIDEVDRASGYGPAV